MLRDNRSCFWFVKFVAPLLSILVTIITSIGSAQTLSVPAGLHFQGQIVDGNGAPLQAPSVGFTLQLTNPGGSCVLYEETQTLNMTNSNGTFDFVLGSGTPTSGPGSNNPAPAISFTKTFLNSGTFTGLGCGTYSPAAGDARKLKVLFNDGTQTVSLSTPYTITSVPFALYADSLQGKQAADFVQINTGTAAVSQANVESIFSTLTNVTQLQNLIAGTSTLYAKSSVAAGEALPVYAGAPATPAAGSVWFNSTTGKVSYYDGTTTQTVGTSGGSVTSVTAGTGLSGGTITTTGTISMPAVGTAGTYTKVTTDAQGRVSSGTTLAAGDIPALDASQVTTGVFSSAQIPSGTDTTKLPLAGGTMSGAINMGSQNLTNAGYITMSSGKYLGLGSYDDTAETTLLSSILTPGGATYKGVTWYNSTSNAIKYWNGSAAVAIATGSTAISSLNGLTAATQTFANGTAGTAPAFSSSGSTHTLNIPMASTGGTTAGLLSNADYAQIIRKDGTVAFTADQPLGSHKLTGVADPASAQDAATKNYSDTHAAGKNVAAAVATAVTGSAGNGFVMTWDQAGQQWTAAAPATSSTVTSVGLSLPSIFTVTNSPVTSTGTLTGTLASQSANLFLASPNGTAGAPTMRGIASADLPTLPVAKGGTGSTSLTPNGLLMADGTGSTVSSPVCGSGMGYVSNGTSFSCTTLPSATTTFVNGGNSFTANATLGTNDAYTLGLKTGGATRMTIDTSGNVGIGTTTATMPLEVTATFTDPSSGNMRGIRSTVTASPSGNSTQTFNGVRGIMQTPSSNSSNMNELDGLFGIGLHQGSGTVATLNGSSSLAENLGNGTVTNLNAARNEADSVSGTTTNVTASYNLAQNLGPGTVNFVNGSYNMALNNDAANISGLTGVYSAAYDQGTASGNVGFALGGIFYATKFSNSGSLGAATGVRASAGNGSTTTVPVATAFDAQLTNSNSGTITDAYGVSVTYSNSAGGTVGKFKGVYVAPIASPPANYYGLYVDGTTQSYFGGNVGIGTTTPTAKLDVAGHVANSGPAASLSAGCAVTGTITGNDSRGTISLGTNGITGCQVIFAQAYASAPTCVVTPTGSDPGSVRWWVTGNAFAFTINFSAVTSNLQFAYICMQ